MKKFLGILLLTLSSEAFAESTLHGVCVARVLNQEGVIQQVYLKPQNSSSGILLSGVIDGFPIVVRRGPGGAIEHFVILTLSPNSNESVSKAFMWDDLISGKVGVFNYKVADSTTGIQCLIQMLDN